MAIDSPRSGGGGGTRVRRRNSSRRLLCVTRVAAGGEGEAGAEWSEKGVRYSAGGERERTRVPVIVREKQCDCFELMWTAAAAAAAAAACPLERAAVGPRSEGRAVLFAPPLIYSRSIMACYLRVYLGDALI
jgi:hypothetical protein